LREIDAVLLVVANLVQQADVDQCLGLGVVDEVLVAMAAAAHSEILAIAAGQHVGERRFRPCLGQWHEHDGDIGRRPAPIEALGQAAELRARRMQDQQIRARAAASGGNELGLGKRLGLARQREQTGHRSGRRRTRLQKVASLHGGVSRCRLSRTKVTSRFGPSISPGK
jgi:hypothetical protein